MTTTVRILGSRAREQVPGTSITLHAPGFRGALTQLAVDAVPRSAPPLPFVAAAIGADVMLAAQLSMHLEARPPDDGPELRSRSAVAGYARLIVPKRRGSACALLETDAAGVSRFVLADPGDDSECIFPLTIARDGATHRTLRVLAWPVQPVAGPGALTVMSRWERLRRPHQLLQLTRDGGWRMPDWDVLTAGPALLLLHGTFGTPQATFGEWLADDSFAEIRERYGQRCFAFAHPTVSLAPEENLGWLLAHLPPWRAPLDIVAHGRGGLLARVLAADGRVPVRRACLIGTPNCGTPLAAHRKLLEFLDAQVAMLTQVPQLTAHATLEGALCMTRFVAMRLDAALPGLEAMRPDSLLLRALAAFRGGPQQWFTVGAQFVRPGINLSASRAPESDDFSATPNDLVVPSDSCHALGLAPTEELRLGAGQLHHHAYFANRRVRERLMAWLA